ncbi:MAG: leucine-rich repeat domain-containing protein [Clostridia bacterium]|nr:leucine-rich repeat domain-containing protein [Clostridia bacterium]
MKKKLLLTIITLILGVLAIGVVTASAATSGIYTYTVSGSKATITDCDTSASGAITIPNKLGNYKVVAIGDSAFEYCTGLTSITIPDSVTTIGDSAFSDCAFLASVTIGNGVTTIGDGAFSGCDGLTSITIPDSVTTIGASAFYYCDGLTSVTIGNGVTTIGYNAFGNADNLTAHIESVYITDIEAWLNIDFSNRTSTPSCCGANLYLNGTLVTNLTVPDGITSIKDYAFYSCDSLTSITIPDSVTTIGDSAFYHCDGLTSITIPDSVTTIGDRAFYYCTGLTSITIPDSVTTIGDSAFFDCDDLTSVTIGNSVTTIGDSAFSYCDGLTSVTIGNSVELITENAFYGCKNLKIVAISANIKYIRNDAFNGCNNIETVYYEGSEEEWNEILFYNRNENLTNADIIYNAVKKTYRFETNCEATLDDITSYGIFTMPTVANGEMILIGWYDNAALSGDPVTFPYFGDATTLYAGWTDRTGESFEDALIINANQQQSITTTSSGQMVYFEFVPNRNKTYRFYTTGSKDTLGYLYSSSKSQITSDDDDGDGNNFMIEYDLTAGQTYYIGIKLYSGTGSFVFVTEEMGDYLINDLSVCDMSGNSLGAIPKGEFLASISFTNIETNRDAVIVLAQYTADNQFKGLMYIRSKDVPKGSTMEFFLPVDNTNGDIARLKAFSWASFGSLVPVSNSVSFPAE